MFIFLSLILLCVLYPQNTFSQSAFDELDEINTESIDEFALENTFEDLGDNPEAKIKIESIVLSINRKVFIDPKVGDTKDDKERAGLVMRYLSFRQEEIMTVKNFKSKITASKKHLEAPYFFSNSITRVFYNLGEIIDGVRSVTVYVNVGNYFGYGFGMGIIAGILGVYDIRGLKSDYYIGLNRQEVRLSYFGISPYKKGSEFKKFMFDVHGKVLHYWLWSDISDTVYFDSLIYGGDFDLDYVFHPSVIYRQSVGFYGHSTIDKKDKNDDFITANGSPPFGHTSFISLLGNSLLFSTKFSDKGFFANYIEAELGYMYGFANAKETDPITGFDLGFFQLDTQVALQTGPVAHALHFQAGLISPTHQAAYRPYIAKANLYNDFFRTTALKIKTFYRGTSPEDIMINDYGYVANMEYRFGFLKTKFVGLELYFFYDIGAAASKIEELAKNTRHAVGPGFNLHVFDPVGLMAKFNFAFGGPLLQDNDSRPFTFSLQVLTRR